MRILAVLILITIQSPAQYSFVNSYTDNSFNPTIHPYSCMQSAEGSFLFALTGTDTSGQEGLLVIKANYTGNTIWSKYYHSNNYIPRTMAATRDSGCIIGGDKFIMKLFADGTVAWMKTFNSRTAFSIDQYSGGYVVGLLQLPISIGGSCCYDIIKIDESGIIQSSFELGNYVNANQTWIYNVKSMKNGGFLIGNTVFSLTSPGSNLFIADSSFNLYTLMEAYDSDHCFGIQTTDGNVVIAYNNFGVPSFAKFDSTGTVLWETQSSGNFSISAIDTLRNGGIIIAGLDSTDFVISRIDGNGQLLDSYKFCCADTPVVKSTFDGGFITFGIDSLNHNAVLYKVDSLGVCTKTYIDSLVSTLPSLLYFPWSVPGMSNTINIFNDFVNANDVTLIQNQICFSTMLEEITFPIIKISPVPSKGIFHIYTDTEIHNYELIINDIQGRIIYHSNDFEKDIDIRNQQNGIYFLRVNFENKIIYQKLVIAK